MADKPTYEELERRIKELEEVESNRRVTEEMLPVEMFDSIDEVLYVADPSTYEILYVNKTTQKALGKELIGSICYREFQGFDAPCEFCTNDVIIKQKPKPYRWEYYNPKLKRHYTIIDRIIKWPDGRDVRFELAVDITARKQTEAALLESEEKYRDLYKTMTQGVVLQDAEGKIVEANQAAGDILGLTKDQLFGRTAYDPRWKLIREDGFPYDPFEMPSNIALRTGNAVEDVICGIYVPEANEYRWIVIGSAPHFRNNENEPSLTMTVFTDITERKRAEDALKESEERYRALFNASFEAIFLSEKGICLDQNQTAERMFGYTLAEAVGKPGTEWIAPEDREQVKNNMLSSYEKPYQVSALSKNGTTFPAEIQGKIINVTGRSIRVTALRDITERKRAENEIIEQKEKAERYLNLAGVLFISLSPDGIVMLANRQACKVLECHENEIVGQNWFETFIPDGTREEVRAVFDKIIKGLLASVEYYENSVLTKTGLEKIIAWHNTYITDSSGAITSVLSAGEDVSEKRAFEKRYRSIIQTAMDGFVRCDIRGRILEVNPAYCKMSGFTEPELLQMGISDIEAIENQEEVTSHIQKTMTSGQDWFESRHRCKDRSTIDVEVMVQYRNEDGGHFVSFIKDITTRKKQENELQFQSLLLDQIQDHVTATDLNGKII